MKKEQHTTEKVLSHKLFLQREYNYSHLSYEKELNFYNAVKSGDTELLEEIMLPLKDAQLGTLSPNPVRNIKYHLIVTIALITRFCMEGGLAPETAYTLSDLYIQQVDSCQTEEEVSILHRKIVFEYANRMKAIKNQPVISKPVVLLMDYIYDHLNEKISLDDISKELSMSKTYLCALFKKECSMTIGQYINQLKIESASNMLIYADFSCSEISNYFGFSSCSHFISSFKKQIGMTPNEYRKHFYRHHFNTNDSAYPESDLAASLK